MSVLKINRERYNHILERYFTFKNETTSVEPLIQIMKSFRKEKFSIILNFLIHHPEIANNFGYYIQNLFNGKTFNLSLTESNILTENSFFPELKKRVLNAVLPPISNENSIGYIVDNVSVIPSVDLKYFKQIPQEELDKFFELLGISDYITKPSVRRSLLYSANVLAWRVIGNAMDMEVLRMVPEYQNLGNPFLALQNELDTLISEFKQNQNFQLHSKDELTKQLKIYWKQCEEFVDTAFKNSSAYGISGRTNQSLLKIRQQLNRMKEVLMLLVIDEEKDILHNSQKLFLNFYFANIGFT